MNNRRQYVRILFKLFAGKIFSFSKHFNLKELSLILSYLSDNGGIINFMKMFAQDDNCEEYLIKIISKNSANTSLLNSLATCSYTPKKILRLLKNSEVESVSEHATLSLICLKLDKGLNSKKVNKLLNKHQGDSGVGVRYHVAAHRLTPVDILVKLVEDETEVVSKTANKNLISRSSTNI